MFSTEFERIASQHTNLRPHLEAISNGLCGAGYDPVLVPRVFACAQKLPEEIVEAVFDLLVEAGALRTVDRQVCSSCGTAVEIGDQGERCECGGRARATERSYRVAVLGSPPSYAERRARRLAERPRIAVLTALPEEAAAVRALMSEPTAMARGGAVKRVYDVGEMSALGGARHAIIHASLPGIGNNPAAVRTANLLGDFPSLKQVLLLGIAGGAPNVARPAEHIRLGDVVACDGKGVVGYDFVKRERGRVEIRHPPRAPSAEFIDAFHRLEASRRLGSAPWDRYLEDGLRTLGIARPPDASDKLKDSRDPARTLEHPEDPERAIGKPRIFSGTIGAASTLLKDPVLRDRLRDEYGIRAIEMEASGCAEAVWQEQASYFVVRGICDYCDGEKNDVWHPYAAVAAAAYARALLEVIPP